jgi:hypothetical protein
MKRNLFIGVLAVNFFMIVNQANAQEPSARSITIENKVGRITWLFADSAASSVIFYNAFKDLYAKNNELYEYDLKDPTEAEQLFIEMFLILHKDFFYCYNDPEEEHTVVMGFIEEDQITEFQIYILSVGFRVDIHNINFVFMCNTVNDEQALFCNIEN